MIMRQPSAAIQAGVYRIAAAVLTGAGNATIGLGGTVEGIASEAWLLLRILKDIHGHTM
jgi:hypothetical protein